MATTKLKICYVDMCNGLPNQAGRCFRRLVDGLKAKAQAKNPGLELEFVHVQPRNLDEVADRTADIVLSSGGPGSPYDGWEDRWCTEYRKFLDFVAEKNRTDPEHAPQFLGVCHSFELATIHFKVASVSMRPSGRKFGVMPAYVTPEGAGSVMFAPFGERLFVWEHRHWEAVNLDEARLRELGGKVLARESRPGRHDKGVGLLAFEYCPGLVATQFHPEADRQGVDAWVYNPEHAEEFKKTYGEPLYKRMIKTLSDPSRVARTFAIFVPSWLHDRFDAWARVRGLNPVGAPEQDLNEFFTEKAAANG